MRIFNRKTLTDFWEKHRDAEQPLRLWHSIVEKSDWQGPADIRSVFRSADCIANDQVIFNIKGNSYRIVAHVRYTPLCLVFIRFIGTHADYDKIDAETV